jgi:beta-galactosidase
MNQRWRVKVWICVALMALCGRSAVLAREVTLLDKGWRFIREDVAEAAQPAFDDQKWLPVTIPHNYGWEQAEGGGEDCKDYYRGPAWYRLSFKAAAAVAGQRVFLTFDAVSLVADVYLNGKLLGQHRGGFSAFCFEATGAIKAGEVNVLSVRSDSGKAADVAPHGGDFNIYGGIYRSVRLMTTGPVCISPFDHGSVGVAVLQKNVSAESVDLEAKVQVAGAGQSVQVRLSVQDAAGKVAGSSVKDVKDSGQPTQDVSFGFKLMKPTLWQGVKNPYLYTVVAEVLGAGGQVLDRVEQPLGVRSVRVDSKQGLLLNGKKYPVRGVNRHQERVGRGWATTPADLKEDFDLIREMGATAVRLAHYQHGHEFLDLCDRAGMLVWAEVALVGPWEGTPEFEANVKLQLVELIRQQINHPSVFTWSLYNEVRDSNGFAEALARLNAVAHQEDPTRGTIAATCHKAPPIHTVTDWLGWNRYPLWYATNSPAMMLDEKQGTSREGNFVVSEYGAGACVLNHEENPKQPIANKTPWHPEEWQSHVHEQAWSAIRERSFIWGSFVWVMFDFHSAKRNEGDHAGRNDKGLVSADRQVRKDAFSFYKANWTDEPMVYITSRRFVERQQPKVGIKVYGNVDSIELKVNGVSQGSVKPDSLQIAKWSDVELKMGENKIEITGSRGGKSVADSCTWQRIEPKPVVAAKTDRADGQPSVTAPKKPAGGKKGAVGKKPSTGTKAPAKKKVEADET